MQVDYGKYIKDADGFAQVLPEHKLLIVETFRQLGYKCGMTGDGVNDALPSNALMLELLSLVLLVLPQISFSPRKN